ncbi:MAG: membrane protein insertion efficiency factor YidD [Bdellovibrio sp.]
MKKGLVLFAIASRKAALLLIEIYRVVLAPHVGGACRFHPSCSEYATQAFSKHNFWDAFIFTGSRLLKCRPGGPSGYDPVPETVHCCSRGHHEFSK